MHFTRASDLHKIWGIGHLGSPELHLKKDKRNTQNQHSHSDHSQIHFHPIYQSMWDEFKSLKAFYYQLTLV